ncbi:apoptosis-inducing factor 1, mitochondrial-like [Octopus sinensis]|uniref:Apoptosis-inducing factor 1, mitochondrial-like n=1 Tax=Octopus sinensis TaxID=2607531 RepID=A0A6P7TXI9_9MOLL|nr:apoptosis-inducing factor 1, mitochondrial-like [Octopus sinensis]
MLFGRLFTRLSKSSISKNNRFYKLFGSSIPCLVGSICGYFYYDNSPYIHMTGSIKENFENGENSSKYIQKLPNHVQYLLIGDGVEIFSAAQAIRASDVTSKVAVVCPRGHPPYIRDAFVREFVDFDRDISSRQEIYNVFKKLFFEQPNFYLDISDYSNIENGAIFIANNLRVDSVDSESCTAKFGPEIVKFDRCLVSPSAVPKISRNLIHNLSTFDDFLDIFSVLSEAKNVIISGDSIMVAQLISILQTHPQRLFNLTYVRRSDRPLLSGVLPLHLAQVVENELEKYGLKVIITKENTETVCPHGVKVSLCLEDGVTVEGDLYIEISPDSRINHLFGTSSSDEGEVMADKYLNVSPNIWAVGDSVSVENFYFGKRSFQGYDNAFMSGKLAGLNMTGHEMIHRIIPMFWSYVGPIELEGCGVLDPVLRTVSVFEDEQAKSISERRGVIFYLNEDSVIVGVCLWNPTRKSSSHLLRQVVASKMKEDDILGVSKLINLFDVEDNNDEP